MSGAVRLPGEGDGWVFAYGALMWDPVFIAVEARPALLRGYHRAFCVASLSYRGSEADPGLVLGLDRGGACRGRAFRIAAAERAAAEAAIAEREMDRGIYRCRHLPVRTEAGAVPALCLVVNRADSLYAGRLSFEETARRIARCRGARGSNRDYLAATHAHLEAMGVRDRTLARLLARVDVLRAGR